MHLYMGLSFTLMKITNCFFRGYSTTIHPQLNEINHKPPSTGAHEKFCIFMYVYILVWLVQNVTSSTLPHAAQSLYIGCKRYKHIPDVCTLRWFWCVSVSYLNWCISLYSYWHRIVWKQQQICISTNTAYVPVSFIRTSN